MKWYLLEQFPPYYLKELKKLKGIEVEDISSLSDEEVLRRLEDAHGFIFRSRFQIDREFINRYPHLQWIIRVGVGLDHIDYVYAEARGIKVFHTPGANAKAVAIHALGMLLALLKRIVKADREVHQWLWLRHENKGIEPWDLTVGLIGFGNTGSTFSQVLSPLVKQILVYDKYKQVTPCLNIRPSSWDEIYEKVDILSFHVPLTEETYHYLNRKVLERFQRPFWLLNLSRGRVVETAAVIQGLKEGKILGAALDVLENENLSQLTPQEREEFVWLLNHPYVILTPHIGGWSEQADRNALKMVLDVIRSLVETPIQSTS